MKRIYYYDSKYFKTNDCLPDSKVATTILGYHSTEDRYKQRSTQRIKAAGW